MFFSHADSDWTGEGCCIVPQPVVQALQQERTTTGQTASSSWLNDPLYHTFAEIFCLCPDHHHQPVCMEPSILVQSRNVTFVWADCFANNAIAKVWSRLNAG